jgi:hypothetical protein
MQPVKRRSASVPYLWYLLIGALLVLGGLGWLGSAYSAQGANFDLVGSLPCPAILFVGGAALLVLGLRDQRALARVSRPEVTLSTQSPRVGEVVTLSYQQTFRTRTDVKSIEFQLIRRESETHSAGKSTVTNTNDTLQQEHQLPGRSFEAGESFQAQYQFQPQGMHTFHSVWHKVDWLIRARVELAGLPAFAEDYPLQVGPEFVE